MPRLTKQTLDGNIETLILATLQQGPSYGYQIGRDLNKKAGDLLQLGEGTIYPVLHRLETRKLIAATWRKGPSGRQRKYYRLTATGRRALAENRRQWAGLVRLMDVVLEPERNPSAQ